MAQPAPDGHVDRMGDEGGDGSEVVAVRVSAEVAEVLGRWAEAEGLKRSDLVIKILRDAVVKAGYATGSQAP
jgi:hypothetical protein